MIPIHRGQQKKVGGAESGAASVSSDSLSGKFKPTSTTLNATLNSLEELSIGISQNQFKRNKVALKRERIFDDQSLLDHYFKSSVLLNTDEFFETLLKDVINQTFHSRDELLAYIEKKISDVGNQFIFLSKSSDLISEKLNDLNKNSQEYHKLLKLSNTISKSINRLLDYGADKITAAMNVSNVVYDFLDIEKNTNPNKMLEFYFKSVMGYENILSILRYIDNNFSPSSIFRAIDFLLESTSADLKNPLISTNPDKLHSINSDIAKLRVLKTTYKRFKDTVQYMLSLSNRSLEEEDENENH